MGATLGALLCRLLVAAAVVGWAGGARVVGPQFSPSSHQCIEGGHERQRVCLLSNVFLFEGRLHYVAESKQTVLPRLPTGIIQVAHDRKSVKRNFLRPIVVTPSSLPPGVFEAPVMDLSRPQDEVYLWAGTKGGNYYHTVSEFLPTLHATLCRYLGRCTADNTTGLHIVDVANQGGRNVGKVAHTLEDGLACFTPQPLLHLNGSELRGSVVLVRRALVGVGPQCRASAHYCEGIPENGGLTAIDPQLYASFRQRMAACLGFNADAQAPMHPRPKMLLVNRDYSSSRSILNLREVMAAVMQRYSGLADIQLQYMEGMSLREQAQLWSRQSIVVHVHGAAFGNWQFMAHNSVVVHVETHSGGLPKDGPFCDDQAKDLAPVTNFSYVMVVNSDYAYTRLQLERVLSDPRWQQLTPRQKLGVLERGDCAALGGRLSQHCSGTWMHRRLDLALHPELLLRGIDEAVWQLYAKRGLPAPELPPLQSMASGGNGNSSSVAASGSGAHMAVGLQLPLQSWLQAGPAARSLGGGLKICGRTAVPYAAEERVLLVALVGLLMYATARQWRQGQVGSYLRLHARQ